jgi:hypothetical protein
MKVKLFDEGVRNRFWQYFSIISGIISFVLLFNFIPRQYVEYLSYFGIVIFVVLIIIYLTIWGRANIVTDINFEIDGSIVNIKSGDLFSEEGLKAIAFNEYFDTIVDDKIISSNSLNGIFINNYFKNNVSELDSIIDNTILEEDIIDDHVIRLQRGKTKRTRLSTIVVFNDFLLTAFSKFDRYDRAILTMPEYIEFLINFWDRVNRIYAQRNISVPIFGSGITRIKEHKNIGDEELLKIMIWTFKLSEMKFKYPAKLTIVINKEKIKQINLFNLKSI